jgi:alpha-methylacyl-CoA racemase
VLELAGLGPAPHAAMLFADQGADVVRIVRPNSTGLTQGDVDLSKLMSRNKRAVALDLKRPEQLQQMLELVERCDVLIEGMRPGAAERLGIGPRSCQDRNSRLIYARMTGWGQDGPLARRAGHDINYLALSGTLDAIGRAGQPPYAPINLVADFGGGSMLLVIGVLLALWERERSGRGQVVDAAMVDGAALLSQMLWEMRTRGVWSGQRGTNLLDGGAPFYDTYQCADGRYVAVGALEPQFYARLLDGLELDGAELPAQSDREGWPELRATLAAAFRRRTRDEWAERFESTDACVTPVLTGDEAPAHPHNRYRHTVTTVNGQPQPAPAPRLSRTPAQPPAPSQDASVAEIRDEWSSPWP